MRARVLVACVLTVLVGSAPAVVAKEPGRVVVEIRGGYLNEAAFVPYDVRPTTDPDVLAVRFTGGSVWDGDLTGHTVINGSGTIDAVTGAMRATYTEVFYGTWTPGQLTGSITTKGYAVVDEHQAFLARARIVGGTCDFAGSTGRIGYDGYSLNGGYVGTWARPRTPPGGTCQPSAPPFP